MSLSPVCHMDGKIHPTGQRWRTPPKHWPFPRGALLFQGAACLAAPQLRDCGPGEQLVFPGCHSTSALTHQKPCSLLHNLDACALCQQLSLAKSLGSCSERASLSNPVPIPVGLSSWADPFPGFGQTTECCPGAKWLLCVQSAWPVGCLVHLLATLISY